MKRNRLCFWVAVLGTALVFESVQAVWVPGRRKLAPRRQAQPGQWIYPVTPWSNYYYKNYYLRQKNSSGTPTTPPVQATAPWELMPNQDGYWFQSRYKPNDSYEHHNIRAAARPLWVNVPDGWGGYRLIPAQVGELVLESPPGSRTYFPVDAGVREKLVERYVAGYKDPTIREQWRAQSKLAAVENIIRRYRGQLPDITEPPPPPPEAAPPPADPQTGHSGSGPAGPVADRHPIDVRPKEAAIAKLSPFEELFKQGTEKTLPLVCRDEKGVGEPKKVNLGLVHWDDGPKDAENLRGYLLPEELPSDWQRRALRMTKVDGEYRAAQPESPLGAGVELYFNPAASENEPTLKVMGARNFDCYSAGKAPLTVAKKQRVKPAEIWRDLNRDPEERLVNLLETRCMDCHDPDRDVGTWIHGFKTGQKTISFRDTAADGQFGAKRHLLTQINEWVTKAHPEENRDRCPLEKPEEKSTEKGMSQIEIEAIRGLVQRWQTATEEDVLNPDL